MAIDFPASPTVGQEHTSGTVVYVWNGTGWTVKGASTSDLATKVYVDAQDALKVAKAGDTMSGDLTIAKTNTLLSLKTPASGQYNAIQSFVNNKLRWGISLSDGQPETGNNTGSHFSIARCDDAGVFIDSPIAILRNTGQVLLNGVPAAPLDAMAYSGMQVNGSMDVSQERGSDVTSTSGTYICDSWLLFRNGTMVLMANSTTNVYFPGIPYYLNLIISTPQVSLAAGDYAMVSTPIEGYRCSRLAWGTANAKPITIGFWSMHQIAGLYSIAIHNYANSRSYVSTYTHTSSNNAQYNTITIPGDTSGTWNTDNLPGMNIFFTLATGATRMASSANTWLAGDYSSAPGSVNGVGAANVFRIAGVVVLPGTQAPTAAQSPLIMRPFDQELVLCKRYWQCSNETTPKGGVGLVGSLSGNSFSFNNNILGTWPFGVEMRAIPTSTLWANGTSNQARNDSTGAFVTVSYIGSSTISKTRQNGVAITGGTFAVNTPYSFELQWDARL